jgi:polyisoprenoid-binding protein YceI
MIFDRLILLKSTIMIRSLLNRKIYIFLVIATIFQACERRKEADKAIISEEEQTREAVGREFTVDTASSYIRFTGYGVGKNHPGKFRLSSGTVTVSDHQVTGGSFDIDIKSMDLEQKETPFQTKLKPHLLSGDFFDAAKFGTAKFEITNVTPYTPDDNDTSIVSGANFNISGNLTLKDVTKNVTFPAKIDLDGDRLKGKSNFQIDRSQWQMNYGYDKTLGDKFISETVQIELDLEATAANPSP